jgi:hypothetical protein
MSLILSGTDGLSDVDGSASTPAIRGTDTNTGIFFPAADTIAFAEGGTEAMRITSTGEVGVGTNSPGSFGKFVVKQAANTSIASLGLVAQASSTDTFVSIGYQSTSDTCRLVASYISTGAFKPLSFWTSDTERMRIDTSGNVGIGTSSPVGKLSIQSSTSSTVTNGITLDNNGGGAGNGIALNFYGSGTAQPFTGRVNSLDDGNFGYHMVFSNKTPGSGGAGALTERMRIDSSGNLLVGTTTAGAKVTIAGATSSISTFSLKAGNSSGTLALGVRDDGYVTIPQNYNLTTGSAANMFFDSSGYPYRSTSSLKYKKNVQDAVHGLTQLMNLRSVTYEGKSDADAGKTFGGLIAEEVHEVGLTEFVQYAEDGTPDALHYGNMVSICIKAIQEQQAIITELKTRIESLESK